MRNDYNFTPEEAYLTIAKDWLEWEVKTKAEKMVIGLSGGKDSAIVAALATRIFGRDRVIGVTMPQGKQSTEYAYTLAEFLDIKIYEANIEGSFDEIIFQMRDNNVLASDDTCINLPARIRMSVLFAYAQTLQGRVICTSNLSERMTGFSTFFGDHAGCYAPLWDLTVEEIKKLGEWLGLPKEFVYKTPEDGLCGKTDEEKLGFTYVNLDKLIRFGTGDSRLQEEVNNLYVANKFKDEIIRIPHPKFDLPNCIKNKPYQPPF